MPLSFEKYLTTEDNSDINEDIEVEIRKELLSLNPSGAHELVEKKLHRGKMRIISPGLDVLYKEIFDDPAREQSMGDVEEISWVVTSSHLRAFHVIEEFLLEERGYKYDHSKFKQILVEEPK